jgi:uncharacterized delta-60 repeat protein
LSFCKISQLLTKTCVLTVAFNPGTGVGVNDLGSFTSSIFSVVYQPDGKVLIGGFFNSYNGTARKNIARLNADGSLDASFNPGTGTNSEIYSVAYQSDGKVLIGGTFTSYNGTARNRIARLNADGSLDGSFDPGTGANGTVYSITELGGLVLIAGDFSNYNGSNRKGIARLNFDGSLDATFANTSNGANGPIYSVAFQNNKFLLGGDFTSYRGSSRNRIAQLDFDGTVDLSFTTGTGSNAGANGTITSVAYQSDNKVLISGQFTSYRGTARNRIARFKYRWYY